MSGTIKVTADRVELEDVSADGQPSTLRSATTGVGSSARAGDVTFIQNSLTELPNNVIDTNALIANSCIARSSRNDGTFTITGSGGLPYHPGDLSASTYPTDAVRGVDNTHISSNSTRELWQKGDPIVEPSGVYRLADGKLVMSRECR